MSFWPISHFGWFSVFCSLVFCVVSIKVNFSFFFFSRKTSCKTISRLKLLCCSMNRFLFSCLFNYLRIDTNLFNLEIWGFFARFSLFYLAYVSFPYRNFCQYCICF